MFGFTAFFAAFVMLAAVAAKTCWKKHKKDYVFFDTLSTAKNPAQLQMGYISGSFDGVFEGTPYPPTGQGSLSKKQCQEYCDKLGHHVCAAAQVIISSLTFLYRYDTLPLLNSSGIAAWGLRQRGATCLLLLNTNTARSTWLPQFLKRLPLLVDGQCTVAISVKNQVIFSTLVS